MSDIVYAPWGDREGFITQVYNDRGLYLGVVYLGTGIDMFCFGLIVCQFLLWKVRLDRDEKWAVRTLVYWMTAGSLAQTIWCQAFGWSIYVSDYGDPTSILRGWFTKGNCLFELLLGMPVELYYGARAYQLWGKPRWIMLSFPVIFFGSLGIGIANLIIGPSDPISATGGPYFVAWVVSVLFLDWWLSAIIILALYKKRSGIAHTDKIVTRVIRLSAEAQVMPSLVAIGMFLKAFVAPHSLIVLVFLFIPKVWVMSAMLVINSRQSLRHDMEVERQRRQNTLNFVSTDNDGGPTPSTGTDNQSGLTVPTMFFSHPVNIASPLTEKNGSTYTPPMSNPSSSPSKSTASFASSLPRIGTVDRLDVGMLSERRGGSLSSKKGGVLEILSSRSGDADDEAGDMSFEDMLRA